MAPSTVLPKWTQQEYQAVEIEQAADGPAHCAGAERSGAEAAVLLTTAGASGDRGAAGAGCRLPQPSASDAALGSDIPARRNAFSLLWDNGTAAVATAAVLFAFSVLSVKLLGHRVPVLEITLVRSSLSFAVTLAIARLRGVAPIFGRRESWWKLVCRGVTGSLAMASYYTCVLLIPLGDATTLFFTNPAITAVLAWLLLGEHLGLRGAAGSLLSLAGLVVLMHPPFLGGGHADWGPARALGVLCGAASALFSSGAFISIRFIGKAEPALVVAMYFHTATIVISAGPLAFGWPQRAVLPSPGDAGLLLAIAATSFGGQLLLTRGFQLQPASRAASINFSQVVYAYIFGVLFFKDRLTLAGAGGSLLIAAGIFLVNSKGAPRGGGGGAAAAPADAVAKASAAARDAAGAGVGSMISLPAFTGLRSGGTESGGDGSGGGGGGGGGGAFGGGRASGGAAAPGDASEHSRLLGPGEVGGRGGGSSGGSGSEGGPPKLQLDAAP